MRFTFIFGFINSVAAKFDAFSQAFFKVLMEVVICHYEVASYKLRCHAKTLNSEYIAFQVTSSYSVKISLR